MSENPFHEKIGEIAKKVVREDLAGELEKMVDTRAEKIVDELVPMLVARELHRLLDGKPEQKKRGPQEEDPDLGDPGTGGGDDPEPEPSGKKSRRKRPRCKKCGKAMNVTKDGYACKRCK